MTPGEETPNRFWIAGKVIGISVPVRQEGESPETFSERRELFVSRLTTELWGREDFQSIEAASGARSCYFIEFNSGTDDAELLSAVAEAVKLADAMGGSVK